jgi:hypothetical protein
VTTSYDRAAKKVRGILAKSGALSLDRHPLLTIRNLTRRACWFIQRSPMSVITLKRTVIRGTSYRRSLVIRSFRGLTRSYFASEKSWEFAVEGLLFAIIAAISAWPIATAIDALNEFLQRTPS